ncbi:MAG: PilT/PilU family type 4a pilus ATPase [Deltaproteobacteria bacterium]|nr:PilT/PilU family type 4a pilus ATPase [Deltaproteobacteria bacterium]MCB9785517.1 PilT/PilU family type 4a pilus ATPase [Deltaproteobacteria bacterium]
MVEKGASDLHLTAESPAQLRINGSLYPLRTEPLTGRDIEQIAYSVLNERQKKQFEETNEVDLSFRWKGSSRFRANFFRQKGFVAGALRMIPFETLPLSALGMPKSVEDLINRPNGLILVTGPTGSGKSTTLASMIDAINSTHRSHIITIEDPCEFIHTHKKSIVNQREVGTDTGSFHAALRYVLRQDPDVVLIGEIRDLETMESTLRIAETGHLALATLHTNSSVQTIHRILDFFPPRQQDMVRSQVSFVLAGVISQMLIPRQDGKGRVLAVEVMLPNAAIRNLIREDKTHQIYSQMQMGQGKFGNQTFNQSLLTHIQSGAISLEQGLEYSSDQDELTSMVNQWRSDRSGAGRPARGGTGTR